MKEVSGNILKVTESLGLPGSLIRGGNTRVSKCGSDLQLDGGWTGEGDFGGQRIDHLDHTGGTRDRVAVRRLVIVADGVLTGDGWHYGVHNLQQGGIQHITLGILEDGTGIGVFLTGLMNDKCIAIERNTRRIGVLNHRDLANLCCQIAETVHRLVDDRVFTGG